MNIAIRHSEARDSIALQELHGQPETYNGTLQLPYPTEDDWKHRIESMPPGSKSLVAEVEGKVVGSGAIICMARSPRRKHAADLGLAIHKDWRRKGVGSALLDAIVDLADNWMNLSRLELTVYVDNEAAIALYEKHGFEVEGTLREYAFRNGDYVDVYYMSRLKH